MQSNSIQLFENIMSPQKEIRENAEQTLNKLKTLPIAQSLPVFAEGMSSGVENIFQLSTLLFKKHFIEDKEKLKGLSNEEKNSLIVLIQEFL